MIIYNDEVNLIMESPDGVYDDYGRLETVTKKTQAHVRYNIANIYNERGELTTSKAQVYIPYNSAINPLDFRPRIEHVTPLENVMLGKVIKIEYGQNIAGITQFVKMYL